MSYSPYNVMQVMIAKIPYGCRFLLKFASGDEFPLSCSLLNYVYTCVVAGIRMHCFLVITGKMKHPHHLLSYL